MWKKQCFQPWVLMHVWTAIYFLSWIYCRSLSKNRFSQTLSTFTKTFHPFARTTKSELGFMMLTDLPPRAVESSSGYTRSPIGRPAKVLFGCRTFLFNWYCHLQEVIRTLITWRTASVVCLQVSLSLSWRPMWPRGCAKDLLVEFLARNYRENTAIRKFSVFGSVVLYLAHTCQILEPRCSETGFTEQKLASVYFWDDINFFLNSFLFEVGIANLQRPCYLRVFICLIYPEFATCSLALPIMSSIL